MERSGLDQFAVYAPAVLQFVLESGRGGGWWCAVVESAFRVSVLVWWIKFSPFRSAPSLVVRARDRAWRLPSSDPVAWRQASGSRWSFLVLWWSHFLGVEL
ncbi:hypothetical protein DY000_02055998 [Brassica cretica]|uniref:Uncharacterized protein n=1 Tax=Brassica cretica TaxID=69181 RepID=A0ABQ7AHD9_BRACR|nr:hypothetical protein DY000_02055998 [Brassica cretica]